MICHVLPWWEGQMPEIVFYQCPYWGREIYCYRYPGTTRDSIDTKYNRFGFEFNLVDTAGIRRKAKVREDLEFYSVMRSVRAIEHSDVCILMLDATRGFDGQVENIFWLAQRNNKGIVILVNNGI